MIISGNYSMISPIYDKLYINQNQQLEEQKLPDVASQSVESITKLAPISNGLEASAGLEQQDARPSIGTTSRLEELDVEKQMSEVQKDKAIEQYHYFVKDQFQDDDPFFQMIMKY